VEASAVHVAEHEGVVRQTIANLARAVTGAAERSGKPARWWDDLAAADLGLALAAPPNGVVTLRPFGPEEIPGMLARVDAFFEGHSGGGWQIWSAWPLGDLSDAGYERFFIPCMLRPPGSASGDGRVAPSGLEIRQVTAADGLRDSEALLIEAYDVPDTEPGSIYGAGILDDPAYRLWMGYADGVPVSTSTAYVSDGVVGVYNVATAVAARGRGYGEALTWRATLADPALPAVLESSAMGRPIYERMGYRVTAICEVWERAVQR
jgi:hypothetical protein